MVVMKSQNMTILFQILIFCFNFFFFHTSPALTHLQSKFLHLVTLKKEKKIKSKKKSVSFF